MKKLLLPAFIMFLLINSCSTKKQAASSEPACTESLTYAADIQPIMVTHCAGKCHSDKKKAGGIALTTYDLVKKETITGKLICSVKWGRGCDKMPRMANQLPAEVIRKLECWAKNGAPQ